MSKKVVGLFKNKETTFWVFQLVGWAGYFLVRLFGGLTNGYTPDEYWPLALIATVIGFILSIIIRYIYRSFVEKSLGLILIITLLVSGSAGLLFSSLELAVATWVIEADPWYGWERFGNAMFEATVMLAWSAIYFGYHFYDDFQEQQENALKANAMAHQAQLKMLRYQLNPHFLFNTLNAISTLVLEKATEEANEMLSKLSSFLRYTLVNQPTQRVNLEQELYALALYLDIEKVRFADRLNIEYSIDERTKTALIPSLILQPLIENSIKYAIAPSIDGGLIHIKATVHHHRLYLAIEDDGPGIQDENNIVSSSGSGVGLANTRERLNQIYPGTHSFKVKNMEEGGLCVQIKIPLERDRPVREKSAE
ncbi:histidine kinase [Temperatibacter marinus]|uniref:Histidine kinase n=1 Tax=Temperatibacter marinus TaxID=1456591 RepID=A0AA52EEZ8_9PROT|nr:histidine kinase [Temperatibacter marinus]WND01863.1 histidine kinase [Temperatibacter marinus]